MHQRKRCQELVDVGKRILNNNCESSHSTLRKSPPRPTRSTAKKVLAKPGQVVDHYNLATTAHTYHRISLTHLYAIL